jgi:hypothetical protein
MSTVGGSGSSCSAFCFISFLGEDCHGAGGCLDRNCLLVGDPVALSCCSVVGISTADSFLGDKGAAAEACRCLSAVFAATGSTGRGDCSVCESSWDDAFLSGDAARDDDDDDDGAGGFLDRYFRVGDDRVFMLDDSVIRSTFSFLVGFGDDDSVGNPGNDDCTTVLLLLLLYRSILSGDNGRGSGSTSRRGDAGGVDGVGSGAKSDADSTLYDGECGGAGAPSFPFDVSVFLSRLGDIAFSLTVDVDVFLLSLVGGNGRASSVCTVLVLGPGLFVNGGAATDGRFSFLSVANAISTCAFDADVFCGDINLSLFFLFFFSGDTDVFFLAGEAAAAAASCSTLLFCSDDVAEFGDTTAVSAVVEPVAALAGFFFFGERMASRSFE